MDYFKNKAKRLKEEINYYLADDTEKFLRDYYLFCYKEFFMFEYNKELADEILDEATAFNSLLEFKDKIAHIPGIDVRSHSTENYHWYVSDIFKIEPKRSGVRGDETVWQYLGFYFELHSISLDVVPVEYIIEKAKGILNIYYKYAKHFEKDVLSEYWDTVFEGLVRARYECLVVEMNLLMRC